MKANAIAVMTACPTMRKFLPLLLIVPGLVLGPMACSTPNRSSVEAGHSAKAKYAGLELNEGKKWVVAKPMMLHIRNLEKAVQDFEKTPGAEHAKVATDIQENLGRLVTNCTMEGQAHDAVHKWLMPLLGMSAEYSKATDPVVQQAKLEEIKESLQVFHMYFE